MKPHDPKPMQQVYASWRFPSGNLMDAEWWRHDLDGQWYNAAGENSGGHNLTLATNKHQHADAATWLLDNIDRRTCDD